MRTKIAFAEKSMKQHLFYRPYFFFFLSTCSSDWKVLRLLHHIHVHCGKRLQKTLLIFFNYKQ